MIISYTKSLIGDSESTLFLMKIPATKDVLSGKKSKGAFQKGQKAKSLKIRSNRRKKR